MTKTVSLNLTTGIGVITVDDQQIHGVVKAVVVSRPGQPSIVKLTVLAKSVSFRDVKVNVKERRRR